MTDNRLTPAQAAQRAKVSRGTIMNALKSRALIGVRDNKNRWKIDPENLSKWMADRAVTVSDNATDKPVTVLEVELRAARDTIERLEADKAALQADKDAATERESWLRAEIDRTRRSWWPWRR